MKFNKNEFGWKEKASVNTNELSDDVNIKNSLTVGTRIGDIGQFSVAEGNNTTASGAGSHAEGNNTSASNSYCHSEGSSTKATGKTSHAEGSGTTASGNCSHSEGFKTNSIGRNSHAEGDSTIVDTRYAHIVGNGVSDTSRSNAHTLDWNGNAWYAGKLTQEGTPTEDKDLTTKKYVDDAIANQPQISFDTEGNLVVTIGGVTKKFKEITG